MNSLERRKRNEAKLSYEYVASILEVRFDVPEYPDGCLVWKVNKRRGARIGDIAGCIDNEGYWCIKINGIMYKGHRLAWLLEYGSFPNYNIDHTNGVRYSLDIQAMRDTTDNNNKNRKLSSNNTSGYPNIIIRSDCPYRPFRVYVRHNGSRYGNAHKTLEAAIAERDKLLAKFGYHPNHGLDQESREMLG